MFKNTKAYQLAQTVSKLEEEIVWFSVVDKDEFSNQFVEWVQSQLQAGQDGNGNPMGFYSRATEIITQGRKQEGDPYNLFDTGAFYNSMFVVAMADRLNFEADADKAGGNLYELYGNAITKLTDENFENLKLEVKNGYIKYIKRLLSELG